MACIHEAGPIGLEIERTGVPFKVLGLTPGLRHPFDLLRLRDFLYECQPDIVHTFLLTGSLYGRFAAMMARVPVVIGTEVNVYERKRPWHVLAERWLMRGTDAVIASAESVREFYIDQVKADPAKVEVIYNGEVVATVPLSDSKQQATLEKSFKLDRSGWLALRASGPGHLDHPVGALDAHTSPIYVQLAGSPSGARTDAEIFLKWIDRLSLALRLRDRVPNDDLRKHVQNQLEAARAVYLKIAETGR